MTILHYDLVDPRGFELREEGKEREGPGPFDVYLEQLIEEHELADIVERLHADG